MPTPHLLPRRAFLQMGALGLGGLTLPNLLRAEAASGSRSPHKSVILIYLVGGPPHQDMFDLKPDAPKEIAGPWKPIPTNVTGVQLCEALPRLAGLMDKLAVVRSLVGNQAGHDAIQVYNGHNPRKPTPAGGWPQFGSAVAKLQGPVDPSVPPFVSVCYTCTHGPYNEPGAGFLQRMRAGLSRTRSSFSNGMATLLIGGKEIDDELLEEIETQMLVADIGMSRNTESTAAANPAFVIAGAIYSPKSWLDLDVGYRHGLNDQTYRHSIMGGVTARW